MDVKAVVRTAEAVVFMIVIPLVMGYGGEEVFTLYRNQVLAITVP